VLKTGRGPADGNGDTVQVALTGRGEKSLMSLRSWSIRTLFPLLAVSILLSAAVTAGGALLAFHHARDARAAMNNRVAARTDIDTISMLSERVQFNNVVAIFVPTATQTSQQGIAADLALITTTAGHLSSLPLSTSERAAAKEVYTGFQAFAAYLPTIKPSTDPAVTAEVTRKYGEFITTNTAATAKVQKLLTAGLAADKDRLGRAELFSLLLVSILCGLSGVLVAGTILIVGRQINRRLAVLRAGLQELAAGDLRVQIPGGGQRELA
jgi:methyl-accepting chemotaxis protein